MNPSGNEAPAGLSPGTLRLLRAAALRVAEAQQGRAEAIAAAHRSGASMPAIAAATGLDAFAVRDALERVGELAPLRPKGR